jgi:hypothetical protein
MKISGKAFTSKNNRFGTDISKGHPHGPGREKGSAFAGSIADDGNFNLWLEHLTERGKPADAFWFMWYDDTGEPRILESAILRKRDLQETFRRLADFLQAPTGD